MTIYWKNQVAYDDKNNFLAIIHQLPNDYFYGFLNYPTEDIDYQPLDIKELTFEKAVEKIEAIFKEFEDIAELEQLVKNPKESQMPGIFLELFTDFSIHRT
jgi:DNA primase large subunit